MSTAQEHTLAFRSRMAWLDILDAAEVLNDDATHARTYIFRSPELTIEVHHCPQDGDVSVLAFRAKETEPETTITLLACGLPYAMKSESATYFEFMGRLGNRTSGEICGIRVHVAPRRGIERIRSGDAQPGVAAEKPAAGSLSE